MSTRGGGSYSLAEAENGRHGNTLQQPFCTVQFLDTSVNKFHFDPQSKGQVLLDRVYDFLELLEKDYFGLLIATSTELPEEREWLDGESKLGKQLRDNKSHLLFRVRYYVSDPCQLKEEYTRYYFFLQVRNDLLEGRLLCSIEKAAELGSYIMQSEVGDYNPHSNHDGYVADYPIIPKQTSQFESEVAALHARRQGLSPSDSEMSFLRMVRLFDFYGPRPRDATDEKGNSMKISPSADGIVLFNNDRRNLLKWSVIGKLSYKNKQLSIRFNNEARTMKLETNNARICKLLFQSCVDYHTFFRLYEPLPTTHVSSNDARGTTLWSRILSFGNHRPRFTGRTQQAMLDNQRNSLRLTQRHFTRTSLRQPNRRTLLASRNRLRTSTDEMNSSRSNTLTSHSVSQPRLNGRPRSSSRDNVNNNSQSSPAASSLPSVAIIAMDNKRSDKNPFVLRPAPRISALTNAAAASAAASVSHHPNDSAQTSDDDGGFVNKTRQNNFEINPSTHSSSSITTTPVTSTTTTTNEHPFNKFRSSSHNVPRDNKFSDYSSPSSVFGGGGGGGAAAGLPPPPSHPLLSRPGPGPTPPFRASRFSRESSGAKRWNKEDSLELAKEPPVSRTTSSIEEDLVTIRMKPDERGRFGFNIRGGRDRNESVIVSRVGKDMPADLCLPKLNEGDQIFKINSIDINELTHDQIVQLIRSSSDADFPMLELVVRPSMYVVEENLSASSEIVDVTGVASPPNKPLHPSNHQQQHHQHHHQQHQRSQRLTPINSLHDSIIDIQEGLQTSLLIKQFEQLPRVAPGMTFKSATSSMNSSKNRYRDILPYDETRVLLSTQNGSTDYINANFVKMEITGAVGGGGNQLTYIATQGPMAETSAHFWQMIYENDVNVIVMLTAVLERGRVKCHQYWPSTSRTIAYGPLLVSTVRAQERNSFVEREFVLNHKDNKDDEPQQQQQQQQRRVIQLHYTDWPDHGTPDDASEFFHLVERLRELRSNNRAKGGGGGAGAGGSLSSTPIVVHCSAGIGRTGVLILMETALCFIERQIPVMPLQLVQRMRQQRAMMVQTSAQFHFVCEAILRAYKENASNS